MLDGAERAWTSQETHLNSTNYARDKPQTSEHLLARQMP